MKSEGKLKNRGFYKMIFVEAPSSPDAEFVALELLRAEDYLSDDIVKQRSPNARVTFEEIDELVGRPVKRESSGFTFYNMEVESE